MSTGATTPAPTPIEPQATTSSFTRTLQTIYAPTKAFAGLKGATDWIIPFVIMAVLSFAFVYTIDKKVTFEKVSENQIKLSPKAADRIDKLPEDQREKQLQMSVMFTKIFSYAAPALIGIWTLIVALVLWGTYRLACGSRIGFMASFSIVMLSWMPGSIKTVLTIVALFAGLDPDSFNIQNPIATNLGVLFDPLSSTFLYKLASAIDLFMIWTLVVAAIGFSLVGKVKRSTSMAVVFGWYAFVTLIGAGMGALFS